MNNCWIDDINWRGLIVLDWVIFLIKTYYAACITISLSFSMSLNYYLQMCLWLHKLLYILANIYQSSSLVPPSILLWIFCLPYNYTAKINLWLDKHWDLELAARYTKFIPRHNWCIKHKTRKHTFFINLSYLRTFSKI